MKREYWIELTEYYQGIHDGTDLHMDMGQPKFDVLGGSHWRRIEKYEIPNSVHVVAMADVQPLLDALNYIAETEHCDLVETAQAALEKWNGK